MDDSFFAETKSVAETEKPLQKGFQVECADQKRCVDNRVTMSVVSMTLKMICFYDFFRGIA